MGLQSREVGRVHVCAQAAKPCSHSSCSERYTTMRVIWPVAIIDLHSPNPEAHVLFKDSQFNQPLVQQALS